MTWVRLPDTWYSDPVVQEMTDSAQAGFTRLLSWSALHRTDGALRRSALVFTRVHTDAIEEMLFSGLLTETETGWQVVNPEWYLFTEEMRRQKVEAGKLGAAASHGLAPAPAPAKAPAVALDVAPVPAVPSRPVPSPVPVPDPSLSRPEEAPAKKKTGVLEEGTERPFVGDLADAVRSTGHPLGPL